MTGNGNQITFVMSQVEMAVAGNANEIRMEAEVEPLVVSECKGFGNTFPENVVNGGGTQRRSNRNNSSSGWQYQPSQQQQYMSYGSSNNNNNPFSFQSQSMPFQSHQEQVFSNPTNPYYRNPIFSNNISVKAVKSPSVNNYSTNNNNTMNNMFPFSSGNNNRGLNMMEQEE